MAWNFWFSCLQLPSTGITTWATIAGFLWLGLNACLLHAFNTGQSYILSPWDSPRSSLKAFSSGPLKTLQTFPFCSLQSCIGWTRWVISNPVYWDARHCLSCCVINFGSCSTSSWGPLPLPRFTTLCFVDMGPEPGAEHQKKEGMMVVLVCALQRINENPQGLLLPLTLTPECSFSSNLITFAEILD